MPQQLIAVTRSSLRSSLKGERSKSEMFRVIFALAQTLRFCGTLARLSIMISQKAIASFNMLASVRGTVADEF
jgi:hypothetical protein